MLVQRTLVVWTLLFLFAVLNQIESAHAQQEPERVDHEYLVKIVSAPIAARAGLSASNLKQDVLKSFSDLGIDYEPILSQLKTVPKTALTAMQTLPASSVSVDYYRVRLSDTLGIDQQAESQLLLSHPGVTSVTPNYIFKTMQSGVDPFLNSSGSWGQAYQDLWNLNRVNASQAWSITEGEGVKVAVIDSGVDYNHPDLQANIWINSAEVPGNGVDDDANGFIDDVRGFDFTTCEKYGTTGCMQKKLRDADPMDQHGHGTHCAGTIAALRNNGIGIAGVAPKATIMAIRALNIDGSAELIDLADALLYAINNGADVINASWGASGTGKIPIFEEMFDLAQQRGVLLIAAAGNENKLVYDTLPGGSPKVMTVASTDVNDAKSSFSNFSERPYYDSGYRKSIEIAAPGGGGVIAGAVRGSFDHINILSLRAAGTDMYLGAKGYTAGTAIVSEPGTSNQLYYRSSGTSMAAPMVSGGAALVLAHLRTVRQQGSLSSEEYRRELIREVRARLMSSAKKIPEISQPASWLGYGRLDVKAALTEVPEAKIQILDDTVEESLGNNNAIVESGEDGTIRLTLAKEFGDMRSLDGEIIAKDSSTAVFSNARAVFQFDTTSAAQAVQSTPFTFRASGVNFQTPLELTLKLSANNRVIEIPMTLYVGARRLSTSALYTKESFFGGYSPISVPSISNHRIAWADTRFGDSDIMLFDFRTRQTTLVSRAVATQNPHPSNQFNPYLSDDTIAWQDDRDGNWDIRYTKINAIGDDRAISLGDIAGQNQHQPVIQGNNLFFTNETAPGKLNPDLKVMHYDLQAQKLTKLSTQGSQFNPAISATSAVWENSSALGLEIMPDISLINQRVALSLPLFPFRWPIEPAIDGNKIVFIDGTFGAGRDLFVVEFNRTQSQNVFRQLTSDSAQQWRPQIHRNQVVWADDRTGIWGIRAFDLEKAREYTLSVGTRASGVPNTRDGYVTWIQRGSLWVTQLPGFAVAPPPIPTAAPTPPTQAQPTPSAEVKIKIAVRKSSSNVSNKTNGERKISLVTAKNQIISGVSLFAIPLAKKSCPQPLISFATLEGTKRISLRIPDSLGLSKVVLELRSSSGALLGRARLNTNAKPQKGAAIIVEKPNLTKICKSLRATRDDRVK